MTSVNAVQGIKYGFRLMVYVIVVFAIGFVVLGIGIVLIDGGSATVGGLLVLFGSLVVYAGMLGMLYKVIADGVEQGVTAADGSTHAAASKHAET